MSDKPDDDFIVFDAAKARAIEEAFAAMRRKDALPIAHESTKEWKFCESCAGSMETCDCAEPRPIEVWTRI